MEKTLHETQEKLTAATEAIQALTETTSKAALDKVREKRTDLKMALVDAREAGDVEKELEIQEKIQETSDAIKAAEKPAAKPKKVEADPTDYTQSPDWKSWTEDNAWFGKDKRKTALALGIAEDLRANGDKSAGRAFFDQVTNELNEMLGIKDPRTSTSKVEGDSRGSAGGTGRKTYSDLPVEAKHACDDAAGKLVGPNKTFKSLDDWRKAYVVKFFEE
jgi:hypothetical protein